MKYLAICPCCGERVPRDWVWKSTSGQICPACQTAIRQVPRWDWLGSVMLSMMMLLSFPISIAVGALVVNLVWHGGGAIVGGLIGLAAVVPGWVILLYLCFPYVSRYEAIAPRCAACSYNLTGNTSGVCPECGAACARGA